MTMGNKSVLTQFHGINFPGIKIPECPTEETPSVNSWDQQSKRVHPKLN